MSSVVPRSQLTNQEEPFGILIDDTSVINLPLLQGFLGGVGEQATKRWIVKHGIPYIAGRVWTTTGRFVRLGMERELEEKLAALTTNSEDQ